jgi:hypothetical protein
MSPAFKQEEVGDGPQRFRDLNTVKLRPLGFSQPALFNRIIGFVGRAEMQKRSLM